ncbi:MAG: hypothetical protein Q4C71_04535 [Microbacteriaceae bacterium]|nr:hypothetical protein [Microbacteriaceae bacterium]
MTFETKTAEVIHLNQMPHPVLAGMISRGTVERCGPGVRGVTWKDTPILRAAILQALIPEQTTLVQESAAWVWGAKTCENQHLIQCNQGHTRKLSDSDSTSPIVTLHIFNKRLQGNDVCKINEQRITTPLRTISDLLLSSSNFTPQLRAACRFLATLPGLTPTSVLQHLRLRSVPYKHRALTRAAQLWPQYANLFQTTPLA